MKKSKSLKLNAKAFALAGGLLWGLSALLLSWIALWTGFGLQFVELISFGYIGMAPTLLGGVIGGLWGFVDAAIGLWIFAKLYNWLL